MTQRRVLVLTVVHHPDDARIRQREIPALLEAGWQVTYAAPWRGYGLPVPSAGTPRGLVTVDVARASGRRRLAAHRAARTLLRRLGPEHDVVLLHDPELLPLTVGLRLPPVVWDVHEDIVGVAAIRPWLPDVLRRPTAWLATRLERWAERRFTLLLADGDYASRFRRTGHPVVPNTTPVPPDPPPAGTLDEDGRLRIVYLGSITRERGSAELVELGRRLRQASEGRVRLEVLGPAHGAAEEEMAAADARGDLSWAGFVPGPEALRRLDGALAGLSLLHDVANFRPSMPTKVVEYLAHGVPVVTTPLPLAVDVVTRSGAGVVVPFGDVDRTLSHLLSWAEDPQHAAELGRRGHMMAARELDWRTDARSFVQAIERAATAERRPRASS